MSSLDLLALMPMIVLTSVILLLMMVIAFARNLIVTSLSTCLGLVLTLASILWVSQNIEPRSVTPLITVDAYALLFSALIVIGSFFIVLVAHSYHATRGEKQDEFMLLLLQIGRAHV